MHQNLPFIGPSFNSNHSLQPPSTEKLLPFTDLWLLNGNSPINFVSILNLHVMGNRHWEKDRRWEKMKERHCNWDEANWEEWQKSHFRGRIAAGILIIFFGVAIFMERSGMYVPGWLVSVPTVLIAIGLISLVKHKFRKLWGWALVSIGSVLLANEIVPRFIDKRMILPGIIILFGLFMVIKAFSHQKKKRSRPFNRLKQKAEKGTDEYFESSTVFGGIDKVVVTKNFKGAQISSVFGGHEINLTQADMESEAHMHLHAVFGGITLIVPSHWTVKSDISSVFGGVEDKRPNYSQDWQAESGKTLYLKGSCAFGGIEIQSYK